MLSCSTFSVNNNRLLRLPRCLGSMPSLTTLSATHNKIGYIPQEVTDNGNIKHLRLSCNKITNIPDKIGNLKRLKELSLDWNDIFRLPLTFYQLNKLRTLRIDGNDNLNDPPADVINLGGQAVVNYYKSRYHEDITWRQRVIISSVQACLNQAIDRKIADASLFEPHTKTDGSEDDWFALQLSYFWGELLPELKSMWREEGIKNVRNSNWINSFPFDEREVIWAFSNFQDAYGMLLKRQKAKFRRCACVDSTGRRRPCVPPEVGFMCYRVATLLKMNFVMEGVKKQRLWIAYKQTGIAEAVKKAEEEALKYLHSGAGKLWLETEAYNRAESALTAMGGDRVEQWREKALHMRQTSIMDYYEKKKARVEKIRDDKAFHMQEELDSVKEEYKKAKPGYMKTALHGQIEELIKRLANMDENVHIQRLSLECERRVNDAKDAMYDNDSTDSSDSDASLPDSQDDSELATMRRERYIRRYEERLDEEKVKRRLRPLEPIPLTITEQAVEQAKMLVLPVLGVIMPHNRKNEKIRAARYKSLKKTIQHIGDVVDIRVRKFFMQVGGDFDEIQKEAKHELYRQYLETNVEQARERAKNEFDVIDQVRESMGGVGIEKIFKAWKRWALNKLQRIRRDARAEFRTNNLMFTAAMESVEIAQANVDMWKKNIDIYTEQPYWINDLSKEVTDERPGLHNFLPPTFHMPEPPPPLPEGVSLETSSDESEDAFRKVKASNTKKLKEIAKEKMEKAERLAREEKRKAKAAKKNKKYVSLGSSSESESDSSSSESDSEQGQDQAAGDVPDDISALSETSSVALQAQMELLPHLRRRKSDVHSPRDWTAAPGDDMSIERGAARIQNASAEELATATMTVGAASVQFSLTKTLQTHSSAATKFSYGPDSLRSLRKGKPIFQDKEPREAPPTELELRVGAAREWMVVHKPEELAKKEQFNVEPTPMEVVQKDRFKRAEAEFITADRIIRKKRSGLSVARHQTYMDQAVRAPRSLEENIEARRKREAEIEVYEKPDTARLLDLAGGDERMTNLPTKSGLQLREVLAHRALEIQKSMHNRAVKKKLTKPKKWSFVEHYIAPIWRENALNSDDEETDDEEEFREGQARKKERKQEREAVAKVREYMNTGCDAILLFYCWHVPLVQRIRKSWSSFAMFTMIYNNNITAHNYHTHIGFNIFCLSISTGHFGRASGQARGRRGLRAYVGGRDRAAGAAHGQAKSKERPESVPLG